MNKKLTIQELLKRSAFLLSFDVRLALLSVHECPHEFYERWRGACTLYWYQELLGPRCGCQHHRRSDLGEHALGGGIYDTHFDPFDDTIVSECTKCFATWMWSRP
jgi:hypothetical protein